MTKKTTKQFLLSCERYYYYHAESDSLFSTNKDYDDEPNPDGCVEQITRQRALELQAELKMKFIPFEISI